ncbi:MAG: hypothetical protein WKG01_09075 [Kofleriaceae bacterium]
MPTLRMILGLSFAMLSGVASPPAAAEPATSAVDEAAARATATAFIGALERGDAAAIERLIQAPLTSFLEPLAELTFNERRASKPCARLEKARKVQRAGLKSYARCLAERRTTSTHHELRVTATRARIRIVSSPPESYIQAPDEEGVELELERVRGAYRIRAVRIEQLVGGIEGGAVDDAVDPSAGGFPPPPPPPPPPPRK